MAREIDFRKLRIEVRIDEWEERDVAKELGNALFPQVRDMDEDVLVRKVYHSDGAEGYTDEELQRLDALMERGGIVYAVRRAVMGIQTDLKIDKP